MKGSSLELLSAEVGVTAQAGSNLYSPVVDALLVEKSREETHEGASASEVRRDADSPSKAIEAPSSQGDDVESAKGDEGLPTQEVTPPPNTNDVAVVETPMETEAIPAIVTPTPAEVQDGDQITDPSTEVKTPPARQSPSGDGEKSSSDPNSVYKLIDFDN